MAWGVFRRRPRNQFRTRWVGTVISPRGPSDTVVLDRANRADENPLAGSFTNKVISTHANLKILSNEFAGTNSNNVNSAWITSALNANCEAWLKVTAKPGDGLAISLYARLQNAGGAADGYQVRLLESTAGTDTINIRKIVAGSASSIASFSQEVSVGDWLAIRCIGSFIEAWYKPAAGSWTLLGGVTDETVAAGGNIGLGIQNDVGRADDFGGGNVTVQNLAPSSITSGESFGSVTLATTADLSPSGIATAEAFGAALVAGSNTIEPGGIASGEAFGTPDLALPQRLEPGGVASEEDFGTPEVGRLAPRPISVPLFGKTTRGDDAFELAADGGRLTRVAFPASVRMAKLTVLMDGFGSGAGTALVRGVVYDDAGALVASSAEVAVNSGQAAAWVDFDFEMDGGVALPTDTYELGVVSGGDDAVARVFGDPDPANGKTFDDDYDDGPPSSIPAGHVVIDEDMTVFVTGFFEYAPRATASRISIARLPFELAQTYLRAAGRDGVPRATTLGWHGTRVDPRRASYAVVQRLGPLGDVVGRTVRITARRSGRAPLYAYVVADDPNLADPITVTRRAFMALARPTEEDVPVIVEVLPE